jgi:hypothetical protein
VGLGWFATLGRPIRRVAEVLGPVVVAPDERLDVMRPGQGGSLLSGKTGIGTSRLAPAVPTPTAGVKE